MQASTIAVAVGYLLRDVSGSADAAWWPYALFAYAFLAAVVPWLRGGWIDEEFRPSISVLLGILFASPFWLAARWLADSPYPLIVVGCKIMVALWGIHLLLSVGLWVKNRRREGSSAPSLD